MVSDKSREIYVMSDIEGRIDEFIGHFINIVENNGRNYKIYVLGNAIGRGTHSLQLLEYIRGHRNIELIAGENEYCFMQAFKNEYIIDAITHSSPDNALDKIRKIYSRDKTIINTRELKCLARLIENCGEDMLIRTHSMSKDYIRDIVKYIKGLNYEQHVIVGNTEYCLVHFIPFKNVRDFREKHNLKVGYSDIHQSMVSGNLPIPIEVPGEVVVFGHICTAATNNITPYTVFKGDNVIGVDCGCRLANENSRLACMRLSDRMVRYEPVRDMI